MMEDVKIGNGVTKYVFNAQRDGTLIQKVYAEQ